MLIPHLDYKNKVLCATGRPSSLAAAADRDGVAARTRRRGRRSRLRPPGHGSRSRRQPHERRGALARDRRNPGGRPAAPAGETVGGEWIPPRDFPGLLRPAERPWPESKRQRKTINDSMLAQLAALPAKTTAELKQLWRDLYDRDP